MDYQLFKAINGLAGHSGAVDAVMEAIATNGPYILLALVALFWLLPSPTTPRGLERRLVVYALVTAAIALGINQIIGHLWLRPRPFVAHHVTLLIVGSRDSSFPSDHATLGFSLALPILLRRRDWGVGLLVAALVLGFARVFVGVHYPGDIAGAFVVALCTTVIVWPLRRLLEIAIVPCLRVLVRLRLASPEDIPYPQALGAPLATAA
ncbi:MAG TPA: undecaprenyl-diphosphatase [Chloroflexota bacterium]|jgi:undecaprenyl-diphosphatase